MDGMRGEKRGEKRKQKGREGNVEVGDEEVSIV